MVRQSTLRILGNAFFLLIVFFFLVFIQFRKHSLTFQLGDFAVVLYPSCHDNKTIFTQAVVEGRALEFQLGDDSSEIKEGLFQKPLKLVSYDNSPNTFTLTLEDGIRIRFLLDQDRYFVIHTDNLPSDAATVKICFSLAPKATWKECQDNKSLVHLNYKKQVLELFLNSATSYEDLKLNRLYLSKQPIKLGPFSQKETVNHKDPLPADIQAPSIPQKNTRIKEETFKRFSENDLEMERKNFCEKAYRGLTSRYDKNTGSWLKNKTHVFSEKALIATLAEALVQRTYAHQYSLMKDVPSYHPNETSIKSALYLGNIVNKHAQVKENKREEFSKLFSESALNMTVIENMAEDLFIYANTGEFDRLVNLWENTCVLDQQWNLSQISLFIANYTCTRYLLNKEASKEFFSMLERVLQHFADSYEGTYILAEKGKENWQASLQIAQSILLLTDKKGELSTLREKARTLMTGILKLADKQGIIAGNNSTVYPEDIYAYVSSNSYLPKLIILDRNQRSWLLTASQIIDSKINEGTYRFHLGFYPEFAEHLILNGINYPHSVIFRGIAWRTDPQFQIYTDGWSYLTKSHSLYLKISHFLGENVDLCIETMNDVSPVT